MKTYKTTFKTRGTKIISQHISTPLMIVLMTLFCYTSAKSIIEDPSLITNCHNSGSTSTSSDFPELQGWVDLFDGKTLNGWAVQGGFATYHVEDGMIIGKTAVGSPNTFLCKGNNSNFELELDVKCDLQLNSGIQFRSHVYEKDTPDASNPKLIRKKGVVYGYQCEISTKESCSAGNIYDEARLARFLDNIKTKPGACSAFNDNEWNHYRIVAQGDRIRSWVNGVVCADFRDSQASEGFIGLQVHAIGKNLGPFEVRWKNIRIRELKDIEIIK